MVRKGSEKGCGDDAHWDLNANVPALNKKSTHVIVNDEIYKLVTIRL